VQTHVFHDKIALGQAGGVLLLTIGLALVGSAQELETGSRDPRELIESFCRREFQGEKNTRYQLATFRVPTSPNDPLHHADVAIEGDPLVLVRSFRILKVTVARTTGQALVAYDRVAALPVVENRRPTVRHMPREIVSYRLKQKGNRWLVFDPPLPRMSVAVFVAFCESELQKPGLSDVGPSQKRYVQELKIALKKLKPLVARDQN